MSTFPVPVTFYYLQCKYNIIIWTLYHIPSSCMIIMVHVVKGRQHSAHIWCPNRGDGVSRPRKWQISMAQSQRWSSQHSTASKVQIGYVVDGLLYIAQASYIYIRDYVRQEVQPGLLVRESSTQLITYSLDTGIWYSTYLLIFKAQKGSTEALNFLIITS